MPQRSLVWFEPRGPIVGKRSAKLIQFDDEGLAAEVLARESYFVHVNAINSQRCTSCTSSNWLICKYVRAALSETKRFFNMDHGGRAQQKQVL